MPKKKLSATQEIGVIQDKFKYLLERYNRRYAGAKLSVDVTISQNLMRNFKTEPQQWWDFQRKTAKILGVSVELLSFGEDENTLTLMLPH